LPIIHNGYAGDFFPGDTVRVSFTSTNHADSVRATLTDSPTVSAIRISDGSQLGAGSVSVDVFSTGSNTISVDTAADASFYLAGESYGLLLAQGSTDHNCESWAVGSFSILNRSDRSVMRAAGHL
jgi:hypothetical protein